MCWPGDRKRRGVCAGQVIEKDSVCAGQVIEKDSVCAGQVIEKDSVCAGQVIEKDSVCAGQAIEKGVVCAGQAIINMRNVCWLGDRKKTRRALSRLLESTAIDQSQPRCRSE